MLLSKKECTSASASNHAVPQDSDHFPLTQEYSRVHKPSLPASPSGTTKPFFYQFFTVLSSSHLPFLGWNRQNSGSLETFPRCCEPNNVSKDISYPGRIFCRISQHTICQAFKSGRKIMGFYVFIFLKASLTILLPLKHQLIICPYQHVKLCCKLFFNKSATYARFEPESRDIISFTFFYAQ